MMKRPGVPFVSNPRPLRFVSLSVTTTPGYAGELPGSVKRLYSEKDLLVE